LACLAALLRAVAAVAAAAVAIREASATERPWRERWGAGAAADASDDAGVHTWVAHKRVYPWVVAVKYAGQFRAGRLKDVVWRPLQRLRCSSNPVAPSRPGCARKTSTGGSAP